MFNLLGHCTFSCIITTQHVLNKTNKQFFKFYLKGRHGDLPKGLSYKGMQFSLPLLGIGISINIKSKASKSVVPEIQLTIIIKTTLL